MDLAWEDHQEATIDLKTCLFCDSSSSLPRRVEVSTTLVSVSRERRLV